MKITRVGAVAAVAFLLLTGGYIGALCQINHLWIVLQAPDWWMAVAGLATAMATAALIALGIWQVSEARLERKGWETLKACERYDTDPVLDATLRRLREARLNQTLFRNPDIYKIDIISILNYFEGLATGVGQGLYLPAIVKEHMEQIVQETLDFYLYSTWVQTIDILPSDYNVIVALANKWKEETPP